MRWCPSSADRRCDEGRNHGHKRRPEQSREPRDNHCGAQNDLQSDSILLGNPQLPTLDDEGGSVDASTMEPREQGQVIPNLGDGIVPLGSPGCVSGEELFRAHDLQLDENALKRWSSVTEMRAEGFNENRLILRGRPGQDLKMGDDLKAFAGVENAEGRTLHDDAMLDDNRASGKGVVSGARLYRNTGAVAGGNGLARIRAKGILDTRDGHILVRNFAGRLQAGTRGRPRLEVLIAERGGPQRLLCVEADRP